MYWSYNGYFLPTAEFERMTTYIRTLEELARASTRLVDAIQRLRDEDKTEILRLGRIEKLQSDLIDAQKKHEYSPKEKTGA